MKIKEPTGNVVEVNFEVNLTDHYHRPYNKAEWEVEHAACTINVRDYDGKDKSSPKAWTEIHLSESYTPKNGKRPVNRDIFVTLDTKQRSALIAALLRD